MPNFLDVGSKIAPYGKAEHFLMTVILGSIGGRFMVYTCGNGAQSVKGTQSFLNQKANEGL